MQSCQGTIAKLCKTSIFVTKPNPRTIRFFSTDKTEKIENVERFSKSDEKIENIKEFSKNDEEIENKVELSGFAKAFAKFAEPEPAKPEENQSFAHLLRHSNFIDLGDPEGKVVSGKIFHVVDDDLYIDFGWKFHCVCARPVKNGSDYVRGALVRVRIKDLELSTKFLGATKDLTILEADCTLTSLISTPMRNVTMV